MKHTKRLLALMLTLLLAFGLAMPAMASNPPITPSEPTGNRLLDTFTGWADSLAQRLVDGMDLEDCYTADCFRRALWRQVRPWVIGGALIFALATIVTVVVIVLAVRWING